MINFKQKALEARQALQPFRVIIAGGRNFNDYDYLETTCDYLHERKPFTEVICGLARGADSLGKRWAYSRNIPVVGFPAMWHSYDNAAGPKRNQEMADAADALIAFHDGISRGTADMIARAERKGIPVRVMPYGAVED